MMRSMYAAISGLRNHQLRMDVIGNNIANVNTVGYKASRVTFRELFSQTLRGASAPTNQRGGTNPLQVGLGTALAGIDVIHQPGNAQSTGVPTDMAIEGDGFFVLQDPRGGYVYSRAGDFRLDAQGYLVNADGLQVLGWQAAQNGTLPPPDPTNLDAIQIPVDLMMPAQASTQITWSANLDASAAANTTVTRAIDVYDSLGNKYTLTFTFTKRGSNQWDWSVTAPSGFSGSGTLTFNSTGGLQTGGSANVTGPVNLTLDFNRVTQYAGESTIEGLADGYAAGELMGFTVDASGTITGTFSNGRTQPIAQVALAVFANPGGLLRDGSLYRVSNNSGAPQIGVAGTGGRGTVAPGSLEMSNVDLAREFVDMIVTQRGFQANTRVITTSDEMLQELVNLKR
ncbi:MAG: flagellar hook protein FlgE [Symbiobacteriaceae bacterium]|nr:MAG: flagellar hook-basal body protein [Bacillota bacterium]